MSKLIDRVLAEHGYADRTKDSWTCKCGHSSGRRDWVHHVYEQIEKATRADALADFGLWQDTAEPHLLVWRVPGLDDEDGRCVEVLNTQTGRTWRHWETGGSGFAHRYFEAHPAPEPRPWEEAQIGEVWVLDSDLGERAYLVVSDGRFETEGFVYSPEDRRITAGRRIWPEPGADQ